MFLDRPDTWILLALFYGIMACALLALWAKNRYLTIELDRADKYRAELISGIVRATEDLEKAKRREKAARSHREHMLEEKLKRQAECYEQELTVLRCKCNTLEHAMQGMWPANKEDRGANG